MGKRFIQALAVIIGIIFALLAGGGGYLVYLNTPSPGIHTGGSIFKVQKGESLSAIADRLQDERLIRSSRMLKLLARAMRSEGLFKSGYFRIKPGDTAIDVHNVLVSGYQEQIKVTIPEGWTLKKIAQHLEDKGIAGRQDVLAAASSPELLARFRVPAKNLEGHLYPDTYYFPPNYPAYAVVEQMVDNFFEQLREAAPELAREEPEKLHEKVIMASIVEREYRRPEEAPLIASVFYNRLRNNIGLESCATLEYIITDILDQPHPQYLTAEDKRINSPYNTYKWAGLPPGPISNPGKVALAAAFHPARTNYFYFVLKDPDTGTHYFSESLKQHNWAKYYYLKQVGSGG